MESREVKEMPEITRQELTQLLGAFQKEFILHVDFEGEEDGEEAI